MTPENKIKFNAEIVERFPGILAQIDALMAIFLQFQEVQSAMQEIPFDVELLRVGRFKIQRILNLARDGKADMAMIDDLSGYCSKELPAQFEGLEEMNTQFKEWFREFGLDEGE